MLDADCEPDLKCNITDNSCQEKTGEHKGEFVSGVLTKFLSKGKCPLEWKFGWKPDTKNVAFKHVSNLGGEDACFEHCVSNFPVQTTNVMFMQ